MVLGGFAVGVGVVVVQGEMPAFIGCGGVGEQGEEEQNYGWKKKKKKQNTQRGQGWEQKQGM